MSDPVVGRFISVDPLSIEYPYNSVYAFQENKFGKGVELEGLELGDFVAGVSASLVDNSYPFPNNYRKNRSEGKSQSAFQAGETVGDVISIVQGVLEIAVGGYEATVTTLGVVTAPAAAAGVAVAAHGGSVVLKAAGNLVNRDYNSQGQTGSYTNTHKSGTKYHGKGDESRAAKSGKEKAKQHNDPVKSTDWTPAKNNREAFKQGIHPSKPILCCNS